MSTRTKPLSKMTNRELAAHAKKLEAELRSAQQPVTERAKEKLTKAWQALPRFKIVRTN